ncbi:MAG: DEAD/DEAH box helicase [Flavobacteriales bacterium]|nr:DEAD/DEAH box helicase [Flavobacteriales bacterium]
MSPDERSFEALGVTRQFINAMDDMGYGPPTDIQWQALPRMRSGQDLIGVAQTGTGKTAAFVLPMLMRLKFAQGDAPRAVILEPTKELVIQTSRHVQMLAKYTDLRCAALYGGSGTHQQREDLRSGQDIIVATPGRLMDFYLKGDLILKKLQVLVLDEADRMMDMGFMHQLRSILEVIPVKRQNLLFSATFNERVEELSHEFLEFPTKVEVTPSATPAETIDQYLVELPNFKSKLAYLEGLLAKEEFDRVIVFCRTKDRADRVHRFLDRKVEGGVKVIHSNKGQNTRINAFKDFQDGTLRVLVATDVSARGIDVANVSHVVNFDIPRMREDYTHRIGRTGRALNQGEAISLMDPSEVYFVNQIEELIGGRIERIPLPDDFQEEEFLPGEKKELARELDRQKQKLNPDYKGAFHERKKKSKKKLRKRR